MKPTLYILGLAAILLSAASLSQAGDPPPAAGKPKKIVLIAGKKSHGPGAHEYVKSVKLLKVMLDRSPNLRGVTTEIHFDGWPQDPRTLDDADTIMTISDGQDGDLFSPVPFMTEERMQVMEKQMRRGCGFITFHFSTFAPDKYGEQILEWGGGYFDWQNETGKREWYSAISTLDADVKLGTPDHPISKGLAPFHFKDEFYYKIRFRDHDERLRPILLVPAIAKAPEEQVVAWAVERKDGGRGFGTTTGHFYDNWQDPNYRKLILNAIAWSAHAEVPAGGVESKFYTDAEVDAALAGKPIKAVIVTGHQYPGHPWRETTLAIEDALRPDSRMQVTTVPDPEFLAKPDLHNHDLVVLNYCNWERAGLSDAAKANFIKYLQAGGGLVIVHFTNGAFHFSLPKAAESDWPEWRSKICRRVWDHSLDPTTGRMKSSHDGYGPFKVEIAPGDHPITRGMQAFDTTDELYYDQQGTEPITVLATARSKNTGKDAPMAFVYEYGKGRVFQTVLGHDAASLRPPGVADLLRRGCAWVAGREIVPIEVPAATATSKPALAPGRFVQALDARQTWLEAADNSAYDAKPLTIECWIKLDNKNPFNLLVAKNPKESAAHWELYTYAGSGELSFYQPGCEPSEVKSGVNVVDGKWHYLVATVEAERVRLYVDGKLVQDATVKPASTGGVKSPLWIGAYPPHQLGCDGLIDEVRISSGIRTIDRTPDGPLPPDATTLSLWSFDALGKDNGVDDAGSLKNALRRPGAAQNPQSTGDKTSAVDHFGQESVGFKWTENDSRDDRWSQTDIGPFLTASLPLPGGPALAGIAIRLGDQNEAAICFDTTTLNQRAAWSGKFLKFDPARFGLIAPPQVAGSLHWTLANTAGWGDAKGHYRGLHLHGRRVVLKYTLDDVPIAESPWIERHGDALAFTRTIELAPHSPAWTLAVGDGKRGETATVDGVRLATIEHDGQVIAVTALGDSAQVGVVSGSRLVVHFAPATRPTRAKVLVWAGPKQDLPRFAALVKQSAAPHDLSALIQPGPARWTAPISTQGVVSAAKAPYVVDTLTLPFDNPYRALMFISGHDFFANGDAAVCTVHGDVWRVSGIDERLQTLTWKRLATGLYQPLGLRIVNDHIYVLGRDQITRLADLNGDGEADFYECFCPATPVSAAGHDFTTCLETDTAGNFYYLSANAGLVRVSADGQRQEVIATGFRNPNGLAIGPSDTITVSPQEGNWTPASSIVEVRQGGYYGFGGPKPTPARALGYDPPLCWIPRLQDNSSGGQVWADSDRWGPLTGSLLHFSFGRCSMLLTLRDSVDGQSQGGTVRLPLEFDSGVMRGRFRQQDGQLYVTGLKGWVSSAARDGCLQRVRYTGQAVCLPIGVSVYENGIRVNFTRPLSAESAEDVDNYSLEAWNYRWTGDYGSADFKVSAPKQEGHDTLEVMSASLLSDKQSVFLELADVKPVMQMSLQYTLEAASGQPIADTIYHTINFVPERKIEPTARRAELRPGQLSKAQQARLASGLLARFSQPARSDENQSQPAKPASDARVARLAALIVPQGSVPTPFLSAAAFSANLSGYVYVPLKGPYSFQLRGVGAARLSINGNQVLSGEGELEAIQAAEVSLRKGYNVISLDYDSPQRADAAVRILWSSPSFVAEPLPPTALFHDSADEQLVASSQLRAGRQLFASSGCANCHEFATRASGERTKLKVAMPEADERAPDLIGIGSRLQTQWVAQWLLDPRALRHHSSMPQLLDAKSKPEALQQAADIAAYLNTLADRDSEAPVEPASGDRDQGEILFEDLGCISCHRLTAPTATEPLDRMSLHYVASKYRRRALESYLRQPRAHHAGSRMPDFKLNSREAAALAAFLSENAATGPALLADAAQGDAGRGRKEFERLGCQNCHAAAADKSLVPRRPAPPLAKQSKGGCLAADPSGLASAPRFRFSVEERAALQSLVATGFDSLGQDVPAEASARLVKTLRCSACHNRDGNFSAWPEILADEGTQGLPPEQPVSLTWAGEKLQPRWTQRLLAGELKHRPRPWMKARMPAFASFAPTLAVGLAAEHGIGLAVQPATPIDAAVAEIGRQLTLKDQGLDCRQCHALGYERIQTQQHNAEGVSFLLAKDRLRREFYDRWILDPLRIDPATKMPKFSIDGVTTTVKHVYDGDVSRQFDALWQYMQSLDEARAATSLTPAN